MIGPDGRWIYYSRSGGLWRVPVDGGEGHCVLESVHRGMSAVGREGIYYAPLPDLEAPVCFYLLRLPGGTHEKIACIDQPLYYGLELAPDGESLLYTKIDTAGSDIMLVENFR